MGKIRNAPALSNATIQARLITGAATATNKGGTRGSLTRCAAKLGALNAKMHVLGGLSDEEVESIKAEIQTEVRLFQVEMHKWLVMIQGYEKELVNVAAKEQEMAAAVEQKRRDLQALRNQAATAARTGECWNEYETLAKLVRKRDPCRAMQADLDKVNADLAKTRKQLYLTASESKIREKQFNLLIQLMLDLKRGLGEPVEQHVAQQEKKEQHDNQKIDAKPAAVDKKQEKTTSTGGVQPMEQDDNDAEEDDLYDDLQL